MVPADYPVFFRFFTGFFTCTKRHLSIFSVNDNPCVEYVCEVFQTNPDDLFDWTLVPGSNVTLSGTTTTSIPDILEPASVEYNPVSTDFGSGGILSGRGETMAAVISGALAVRIFEFSRQNSRQAQKS